MNTVNYVGVEQPSLVPNMLVSGLGIFLLVGVIIFIAFKYIKD
ncbi:MAG TPA: hypothetical protein PK831_01700 [Candidatus Magasanikbacteria bacterium]|jgi:hypothetical protein|nr:hypothetical protein [Candidatus Magasanikbacteria bacterium]HQL52472.1 hypothetical protein [Candidatus Magasanikbacteria bacterium]